MSAKCTIDVKKKKILFYSTVKNFRSRVYKDLWKELMVRKKNGHKERERDGYSSRRRWRRMDILQVGRNVISPYEIARLHFHVEQLECRTTWREEGSHRIITRKMPHYYHYYFILQERKAKRSREININKSFVDATKTVERRYLRNAPERVSFFLPIPMAAAVYLEISGI